MMTIKAGVMEDGLVSPVDEGTPQVSPDSMSRSRLNPVEPPWYATRMPGGVGGVAPRGVPLSRSSAQLRRPHTLRRRTETLHQSPEVQK